MMRSIGWSRGLRAFSVLAPVCTLVLMAILSLVAPVAPAGTVGRRVRVSDETHYSRYDLEALHAQGYTGEGVMIAVINGHIDASIPELQDTDIVKKGPCDASVDAESDEYTTYTAQLLAALDFGIVSKTTIYNYVSVLDSQKSSNDYSLGTAYPAGWAKLDYLIEQTINDGANTIAISSTYKKPQSQEMCWTVPWVALSSVPIVVVVGNDRAHDPDSRLGIWGDVIGVSALDKNDSFVDYSNYRKRVILPAMGATVGRSTLDNQLKEVRGVPFVTPMTVGSLAFAWQCFTDGEASANQALQAVLVTVWGTNGQQGERTSYGKISPAALPTDDPSQCPEENSLPEEGSCSAFHEDDLYGYYHGLANPREIANDGRYAYRGADEESTLSKRYGHEVHLGISPLYHYSR